MTAFHATEAGDGLSAMPAMGHFRPFPPPRPSGRCPFSQGTFAGTLGKGRDAPVSAVRELTPGTERGVRPEGRRARMHVGG